MPLEDENIAKLLGQVSDGQQKTLDLLDKLARDTKPKPKDGWDKFQIISSFIAGVLLVIVGGLFTYWYNSAPRGSRLESKANRSSSEVHAIFSRWRGHPYAEERCCSCAWPARR